MKGGRQTHRDTETETAMLMWFQKGIGIVWGNWAIDTNHVLLTIDAIHIPAIDKHSRHTGYRHHSCHTRAKNWTVFFFMCPKTLSEDELKSNGLIWQKNFQVTETLRLWHSCWSLLIAMFTSENQNNMKNTSVLPRAKAWTRSKLQASGCGQSIRDWWH